METIFKKSKIDFWRIHQSYLINSQHMYRVGYSEIEMSDGRILPISEDRRKLIRKKYLHKIEGVLY